MPPKQYTPKMHYCPDCNREFHSLGWPRHRAMHRDRKTNAGTTEEKNYREERLQAISQMQGPDGMGLHRENCQGPLYPGGFCDC